MTLPKSYKPSDFYPYKATRKPSHLDVDLTQVKEKGNDSVTQIHIALVYHNSPFPAAF